MSEKERTVETEDAERTLAPGTITRLAPQRRGTRMSIYLDGEYAFGVHQDLVGAFHLSVGRHLSVAEQRQLIESDALLKARAAAMTYLASRARTEEEVRRKLTTSGYDEATTARVVEHLRGAGYLNDAAYAQAYAESRLRVRGYGPKRIQGELVRRGVDRRLAEAALQTLEREEDLLGVAVRQARRRWPVLQRAEPDPQKRRKKLLDYLLRRGFSYEEARQALSDVEKEQEASGE